MNKLINFNSIVKSIILSTLVVNAGGSSKSGDGSTASAASSSQRTMDRLGSLLVPAVQIPAVPHSTSSDSHKSGRNKINSPQGKVWLGDDRSAAGSSSSDTAKPCLKQSYTVIVNGKKIVIQFGLIKENAAHDIPLGGDASTYSSGQAQTVFRIGKSDNITATPEEISSVLNAVHFPHITETINGSKFVSYIHISSDADKVSAGDIALAVGIGAKLSKAQCPNTKIECTGLEDFDFDQVTTGDRVNHEVATFFNKYMEEQNAKPDLVKLPAFTKACKGWAQVGAFKVTANIVSNPEKGLSITATQFVKDAIKDVLPSFARKNLIINLSTDKLAGSQDEQALACLFAIANAMTGLNQDFTFPNGIPYPEFSLANNVNSAMLLCQKRVPEDQLSANITKPVQAGTATVLNRNGMQLHQVEATVELTRTDRLDIQAPRGFNIDSFNRLLNKFWSTSMDTKKSGLKVTLSAQGSGANSKDTMLAAVVAVYAALNESGNLSFPNNQDVKFESSYIEKIVKDNNAKSKITHSGQVTPVTKYLHSVMGIDPGYQALHEEQDLAALNKRETELHNLNQIINGRNAAQLREVLPTSSQIDFKDLSVLLKLPNLQSVNPNVNIAEFTAINNKLQQMRDTYFEDVQDEQKARTNDLKNINQIEEFIRETNALINGKTLHSAPDLQSKLKEAAQLKKSPESSIHNAECVNANIQLDDFIQYIKANHKLQMSINEVNQMSCVVNQNYDASGESISNLRKINKVITTTRLQVGEQQPDLPEYIANQILALSQRFSAKGFGTLLHNAEEAYNNTYWGRAQRFISWIGSKVF